MLWTCKGAPTDWPIGAPDVGLEHAVVLSHAMAKSTSCGLATNNAPSPSPSEISFLDQRAGAGGTPLLDDFAGGEV